MWGADCSGCTCTPRAEKTNLGVIHRENLRVHPSIPSALPRGARVNFRTFLLCQEDLELELVVLDRLLEATT